VLWRIRSFCSREGGDFCLPKLIKRVCMWEISRAISMIPRISVIGAPPSLPAQKMRALLLTLRGGPARGRIWVSSFIQISSGSGTWRRGMRSLC
jgi:hypothetical protein